uniref:Uncharacterized protein n=2 Tax=unclassified Caudoviricetes TaxID=2788787 RepID=A0A8S5NPV6_9CAUD|nr:MAG TPA: hypothetical protein [Myoviridae sp. ctzRR1]DAD96256.1 MAG TPA: hypothetical protein [Myoviridae sp. ct0mM28]DAV33170.1 MAG TPA: hypothetical protein [Caudoviricetes sp.]
MTNEAGAPSAHHPPHHCGVTRARLYFLDE